VFGTARGRLGAAFDQVLVYGTGGFAWARNELSGSFGPLSISDTQTHFGWTAGGGIEVALNYNWSVKAEYLFAHLGSENYFANIVPGGVASGDAEFHLIKGGINYRFGGPVTARY
jgi:outer membrane immunogenic protein